MLVFLFFRHNRKHNSDCQVVLFSKRREVTGLAMSVSHCKSQMRYQDIERIKKYNKMSLLPAGGQNKRLVVTKFHPKSDVSTGT